MKKTRSFFLESFQLRVFSLSYSLSVIFLFWLFAGFLANISVFLLFGTAIIYLVISIIIWAYLYLLFSIPQRIAGEFDPIKNKIHNGEIKTTGDFAIQICHFLTNFYNYSFFDVAYCAFIIRDQGKWFSSPEISEALDWDDVIHEIESEEVLAHKKIKIKQTIYRGYTIPVFFGEDVLGFFTVFTRNRLGSLRLRLLTDLENHFIDDQLFHVLSLEKKG